MIREATIEALRRGDPALEDAHVERQRTLLFEVLPELFQNARRETADAPWLARVEALLRRYDLA